MFYQTKRLVILWLIILASNIVGNNYKTLAKESLIISAIPDQNPEKINRLYNYLSKELSKQLEIPVIYKPVINYTAAVTAFRTGELDLVWFGGLTGVQARIQRPGAKVIAQRDIDKNFHSVFIANKKSNIKEIKKISGLKVLKGRRFTFGSESSTSGRLMPQYYLEKAGVKISDFKGRTAGFSGSHDTTLMLVQSRSYEAGALNEQVWLQNLKNKRVNENAVKVIWRTPSYADYHWLVQPNLDKKLGGGFTEKLRKTILGLDRADKDQKKILDLFGAKKFIPANERQYKNIEKIGRKIGKIR